jgi:hypothetical protein
LKNRSRVYAPVSEVMNNLAALFYLDVRINRMNGMEALPTQQGQQANGGSFGLSKGQFC